jgi:hypothetical protein
MSFYHFHIKLVDKLLREEVVSLIIAHSREYTISTRSINIVVETSSKECL